MWSLVITVSNMLKYVKRTDRRLLYAEFCYLVRQFQNQEQPKQQMQSQTSKLQKKTAPSKATNSK